MDRLLGLEEVLEQCPLLGELARKIEWLRIGGIGLDLGADRGWDLRGSQAVNDRAASVAPMESTSLTSTERILLAVAAISGFSTTSTSNW